ncbi:hypothetical protein [Halomicronema sp. CCY15110]|uniref:hypothetical protein n=1 Tax=Halomicronema sp. CCY15110 TaxID=2767773 RepID=UPI00194F21C9|nr:hypothetical protein [Halomicronema sp. CCY15110]
MGISETLYKDQPPLSTDHPASPVALSRMFVADGDLAQEYGFERHRRVYACPIDFQDHPCPQPSFLEALLGDG